MVKVVSKDEEVAHHITKRAPTKAHISQIKPSSSKAPPMTTPSPQETMGYEEVPIPDLEEWDPATLPEHFFLVLEGKRRTGKSTFAKWLLQFYTDKFSLVWCMTKTKASGYWQEFVGEAFTFDNWYPNAIERLVDRNDKIIKEFGEDSKEAKKLGSVLLILDDVVSANIFNDPMFIKLAVEGRHHLISVILATQDPKAICPKIRDNADVAVIFNQKTFRNKESIWSDFMNDVPKNVGFSIITKFCVEHSGLVCIQTNLNSDIRKNYMKTTSDKTKLFNPNYMLGGLDQRRIVAEERRIKELEAKRRKLTLRADKRPLDERRLASEDQSSQLTVNKIYEIF